MPEFCQICGKDTDLVGRSHNCVTKWSSATKAVASEALSVTKDKLSIFVKTVDNKSIKVDNKPSLSVNQKPIIVNQVDNKADGVGLISVNHPKFLSIGKTPRDIDPAGLVTGELSDEQVRLLKENADGLRISSKRKRGRPCTTGKPWLLEGISRQAWYKRKKKNDLPHTSPAERIT